MIERLTSFSIKNEVSTSWPSTSPASAALARPEPIEDATSATVIALSKDFNVPSGSVTFGMLKSIKN